MSKLGSLMRKKGLRANIDRKKENKKRKRDFFFLAQHNSIPNQRDQGIWPGSPHVLSEYRVAGKPKAKKSKLGGGLSSWITYL